MTRRSQLSLMLLALLAFSPVAFAHGEGSHLSGHVKALKGDVLTVEALDHDLVEVTLDENTRIEKGKAGGTKADLLPGAKVVVETSKMGSMLMAKRIRLAAAKAHAPPAKK